MDLHCKRCPQCISDILSLTADLNSFRMKYFKPKRNSLFKKGGLNIIGILRVSLIASWLVPEGFLLFVLFFSFLLFLFHLSHSTHLSYDASNLLWFASLPRKTTVELPQKYKIF